MTVVIAEQIIRNIVSITISYSSFEYLHHTPWVFAKKDGSRITLVRRSFKTACRRAGIEDFNIHDLRHTCAAWLVGLGVPLTEVRDLLGHASVVVTDRYAHLSPDNVRAAVAQLDEPMSRFGHADATRGKQIANDGVITA